MSWARDAADAVRRFLLIEERFTLLSEQVKALAVHCSMTCESESRAWKESLSL